MPICGYGRPFCSRAVDHERDHARQVGLKRQELEVVEQLDVRLKPIGHARRSLHVRNLLAALFLGLLDPPLHVAQGLQVVAHLLVVAGSQRLLQLPDARGHRIEDAAVALETLRAHPRVRAFSGTEQALEHHARVVFRHQRQRGRQPRQRAAVSAAVADVACSDQAVVVDRQLQRRQLRVAFEGLGGNLVHGHAVADDAVRLLDVHAGEIRPRCARVVASPVAQRLGLVAGEPGHHDKLFPEWFERLEDRR